MEVNKKIALNIINSNIYNLFHAKNIQPIKFKNVIFLVKFHNNL